LFLIERYSRCTDLNSICSLATLIKLRTLASVFSAQ